MSHLVIGIGVNLAVPPQSETLTAGAVRPVSLLSETGASITPEEFLDALAPAYARWEAKFTSSGFEPIREAWLERAAKLGETVTARTMREEITGIFRDVDAGGNLIMETETGPRVITAAEVYF